MNKYNLIHKLSNISLIMLFIISGYFIFAFRSIKTEFYGIIFIILNLVEIVLFISFFIAGTYCQNGTRKKHARVKIYMSIFVYLLILIFIFISLKG